MAPGLAEHPWCDAAALAELHTFRTQQTLEHAFAGGLVALLPGVDFAVCLAEDVGRYRVAITGGERCPLHGQRETPFDGWAVPATQRLPIRYQQQQLGELLLGSEPAPASRRLLQDALVHFGTALVNLTLHREARQATEDYCANLQALEEGIVLFQEEDPAAITARILSLATTMAQAAAGALYVLEQIGDASSPMRLEQVLGLPDALLAQFRGRDGVEWPGVLLEGSAHLATRDADGSLAGLAPDCVPPILESMLVLPLRYHGVVAGLCVLCNPQCTIGPGRDALSRLQSLGQLAAALLHRLRLEVASAANHTIERDLQIAEAIQQRLLPDGPPDTDSYDFAWRTIPAKNIGGDYLDLMGSPIGEVYAVVADASGHGINSALLMSSFRANYRGQAHWLEPIELVRCLNREVVRDVDATGMFITAALLRLEATGDIVVCSAGHYPPLVYRAASRTVEQLASNGPPLGFVADAEFDVTRGELQPGDLMFVYTDGITEAVDAEQEMFGEERLQVLLQQHAGKPATEVLEAVQQALFQFTGRQRCDDDVSLLVVKRR